MEVAALRIVKILTVLLSCISVIKIGKVRLTTGNVQDSTFVSRGFQTAKIPVCVSVILKTPRTEKE